MQSQNSTPTTPPTTTSKPEKFWLEKDGEHGIYIAIDSKKDVAVQACVFLEQHRQAADGTIESLGMKPQVIFQKVISTAKTDGGKEITIDGAEFKKQVSVAITEARQFITIQKRRYEMSQGALADYWGQAAKHNT